MKASINLKKPGLYRTWQTVKEHTAVDAKQCKRHTKDAMFAGRRTGDTEAETKTTSWKESRCTESTAET